ncbi:uncharacterized protein [Bemisia tabaci]|uniref:uncharacterized protein n=1 Tax=Bemisia tabaci TaxID=7038 RepID=UPI003B28929C
MGKYTRAQSKKVMYHVYLCILAVLKDPSILFAKAPQEAAAEACNTPLTNMKKICAEAKRSKPAEDEEPSFSSPNYKRVRVKKITGWHNFNLDLLRRILFEFYDNRMYPTVRKVRASLTEKIDFEGSVASVFQILKSIGFKYKKGNDGRKYLMEGSDIVAMRDVFLQKLHKLRSEKDSRPVVHLDEAWVNKNHSPNYVWEDADGNQGLVVPTGKRGRIILAHAGSVNFGFVAGAKLVFRAKKNGDYHDEMDGDRFKEWFTNMLQLLEESCVIVMDTSSYHSIILEKVPNTQSRKGEIIEWLKLEKLAHDSTQKKFDLLEIVRRHKPHYVLYELDQLAIKMGH